MLGLLKDAKLVLTDSGGIQEETTALGVPCLTLRENTERPVTVSEGTNRLVGVDPSRILETAKQALAVAPCERKMPELWDGKSALRIADILLCLRNRQR
jgi:UDP-N-acetylglucosamine 2-epimerase (non-hydrolysing)